MPADRPRGRRGQRVGRRRGRQGIVTGRPVATIGRPVASRPAVPVAIGSRPQGRPRSTPAAPVAPAGATGAGSRRGRGRGRNQGRGADRNPIYDPTQQLSGSDLKDMVSQIVRAQIKPQADALKLERQQAERQGGALIDRAGGYYQQLAQEEQGNLDRLAAFNTTLQGQLGQIGDNTQGALDEQAAAARAQQEQVTGLTGVALPLDQLAAEQAAASGRNAQTTANAQIAGVESTRAAGNYSDLSRRATAAMGGEVTGQLANQLASQLADIRQRRSTLGETKGALKAQTLQQLRQQGFENIVTAEGLGLKRDDLAAQIAQTQADQQLARKRLRQQERQSRRQANTTRRGQDVAAETQRRGQDLTARERRLDRASRETIAENRARYGSRTSSNGRKAEPADSVKARAGITNARVDIEKMLQGGRVPDELRRAVRDVAPRLLDAPMNADTARRIVVALGGSGLVAQAAAELAKYGGVRPGTAAKLKDAGIRVPRRWQGAFAGPPTPA